MNKIGIAGWLYHRPILHDKTMTLLELPGTVRSLGFEILELCSVFFANQTATYLTDVRIALEDAGIRVPNIAVDGPILSQVDERARQVHLEATKQWFHVAHAVGATAIRVNSGGSIDANAAEMERIVDGYRQLADMGEREGLQVLIENHGGATTHPRNIATILERVDSKWFGTCPDTGNFPEGTWEEGMTVMAPRASTVHVKLSAASDDGWQEFENRDGSKRTANLRTCLRMLADTGYSGPLCIEQGISEADLGSGAMDAGAYLRRLVTEVTSVADSG